MIGPRSSGKETTNLLRRESHRKIKQAITAKRGV
jgi:hypothetical protein